MVSMTRSLGTVIDDDKIIVVENMHLFIAGSSDKLIMITKLVRKYSYGMMVCSTMQSPGQLHQFIQMEQAAFNAEINQKGRIFGE